MDELFDEIDNEFFNFDDDDDNDFLSSKNLSSLYSYCVFGTEIPFYFDTFQGETYLTCCYCFLFRIITINFDKKTKCMEISTDLINKIYLQGSRISSLAEKRMFC